MTAGSEDLALRRTAKDRVWMRLATQPSRSLIGGFISIVLILLVAFPLIVVYRAHAILSELSEETDPAIKMADGIHAAFSRELAAIVSFQATGEPRYVEGFERQEAVIGSELADLSHLTPHLGTEVEKRFSQLEAAINEWHNDAKTQILATTRLPQGEFKQLLFDRVRVEGRADAATTGLSDAIVDYQSSQHARVERLASLFATLALVFAACASVFAVLVVMTLRRLGKATFDLEIWAGEQEALRHVGHGLTGALTLREVLRRIVETAAFAAEAEAVYIETINVGHREITCVEAYGPQTPAIGSKHLFDGSIAKDVLQARRPRIIQDISAGDEDGSLFREFVKNAENHTAMVVPLIAEEKPLGAIFLIRKRPRYFTEAEFPKVLVLADMASVAIQRAITIERIQTMRAEERFVSEMSAILGSSLDYNATLKAVVHAAVPRIADSCAVHLAEQGRIYTAEIAHNDPAKDAVVQRLRDKYPRPLDRAIGPDHVIRTGKAELLTEITDELFRHYSVDNEHFELLRQLNFKSAMIVPLTTGGETFGSMTFLADQPGRYGHDDLEFAQNVGRHAALSIQNARLYKDAQYAIRMRDDVLRTVSHDLRNPVNNIQLTAALLARTAVADEKRQSMIQMISRAARRMNRLIEDLMTIARLREGQEIPLSLQPENSADIIDDVCMECTPQARAKSIELVCKKPDAVANVMADRSRILQVLFNLVDNALKFTPEGGIIVVSCERRDRDVLFAVSDTGRGIEQKNLRKIFDLFWQAQPTAHLGSGFGLAIARALVERHKGRIWAESKPGIGTTFFVELPEADVSQQPPYGRAA
jgi:signal transduction histidine kinase